MQFSKIDSTFILSRSELKAIIAHASTDDTRAHLNGVGFDVANGCAVATDGHRLAVLREELCVIGAPFEADTKVTIVRLATLERAAKMIPRGGSLRVQVTSPITATLTALEKSGAPGAVLNAEMSDSRDRFPPYVVILPAAVEFGAFPLPTRVGFNANYLADLALVQAAANEAAGKPKTLIGMDVQFPSTALDPMRVTCRSWLVVITAVCIDNGRGDFTPGERRARDAWPQLVRNETAASEAAPKGEPLQ